MTLLETSRLFVLFGVLVGPALAIFLVILDQKMDN